MDPSEIADPTCSSMSGWIWSAVATRWASSVCLAAGCTLTAAELLAARASKSAMSPFSRPPSPVKNLKPLRLKGRWDAVMMIAPSYWNPAEWGKTC